MGKPTAFVGSLAMIPMYSSPMFCQLPTPPAGPGHPPHPAPPGPLLKGAPTVSVNGLPVGRKTDQGLIICCPCNFQFQVTEGSTTVEACNQPVARIGDKVQHMADMQKQAKIILGMPVILTGCGGTDSNALQMSWYKGVQAGKVNAAKAPTVAPKGKVNEASGSVGKGGGSSSGELGKLKLPGDDATSSSTADQKHDLELNFHHDSNGAFAVGVKYQLEGPGGEKAQGTIGKDGKVLQKGVTPGTWRVIIGGETYRSAELAVGGSAATIPVPTTLQDVSLSKKRLYVGASVDISAKVRGVPDGKKAAIELYAEHAPDKLVASLDATVSGGVVKGTWKAALDKSTASPAGTDLEIHVKVDDVELHDVSVQTLHVDTAALIYGF